MGKLKGAAIFLKYQEDHIPVSARKAISAFCFDCMGGYSDGAQDCKSKICPLYPYMPYNKNKVKKTNLHRIGLRPGEKSIVRPEESTVYSDEIDETDED